MPECPACGVIFARMRAPDAARPPASKELEPEPPSEAPPRDLRASKRYALSPRSLALGFAIALIFVAVGPLRFVFSYLLVLIHELGHTATAWFFGVPTLPALDFRYGGGVSIHGERHPAVVLGVGLLLAWGLRTVWPWPRWRLVGLGLAGVWLGALITGLDEALITAMGHGLELVVGGLFLYQALTGRGLRSPLERPVYAFAGWFVVLYNLRFAGQLAFDPAHQEVYGQAKGGGHWMDFSRLSRDVLDTSLGTVAALFLLATALTPALAWLASRNRNRLLEWLSAGGPEE